VSDPTPWTFGLEPLPQSCEVAALMRRITGLVVSLDAEDPAVAKLVDDLRAAEAALVELAPPDVAPRVGDDPPPTHRPYVDHSRDVGAYNAGFPEYELHVDGGTATGSVEFPVAFEGPPGVVHGGVLGTFFDCVAQHHNCDVGVAGKTTSMLIEYRRPTPLGVALTFSVERVADDRRITSTVRLVDGEAVLCTATIEAVAGDRSRLPRVAPRTGST
jgi:acyl-coenzyme A thioesterase PaaI-like protein